MKRILHRISLSMLVCSSAILAQHGHGGGAGSAGGHGAAPVFHNPPKTRGAAPAGSAAANSAASTSVAMRISSNPALTARVQPLLPSGSTVSAAAAGFRNTGQFLAALHVSKNLNIPFTQLKAEMTGGDHDSLGKAIQDLQPNLSKTTVKMDVQLARAQAKQDLSSSRLGTTSTIAARIAANNGLSARVSALLPAGTTLQADAMGFKNTGQFIAALHLSRNLNIPFNQIQAEVAAGKSLGQAIEDLKPSLSSATVSADVRQADRQAMRDIEATEHTVASSR